jgi:hypothetical protein
MSSAPKTSDIVAARRRFLAACGKFAVATPPAVSLLLASAERNYAVAASGGGNTSSNPNFGSGDPFSNNLSFGASNNCNAPSLNAVANRSNCRL